MYKLFQVQVTINRGGQQIGPYTVDQINEYLAQGSLLPTDNAWHEGLPDWVPVSQISGVGHAVTHVEYVNGKPKTVRVFTTKQILVFFIPFYILTSFFVTPRFFKFADWIEKAGFQVPFKELDPEFLIFWGVIGVLLFIGTFGLRKPSTCNQGFNVDKKHYTFFGMQVWKE
jgi:hypothetical protein